MVTPRQGELWWGQLDKRRPVLVVTRTGAVPVLDWTTVAPVTSRARGISTEIPVGRDEGLPRDGVASFDNLQPIRRALLTERIGELGPLGSFRICRALEALADCD